MSDQFDPYYVWLGIPPINQPANHYRLLSLDLFESNTSVIDNAADRQMAHVRSAATGKYAAEAQKLLNELSAARVCLLDNEKKAAYDAELRTQQPPSERSDEARTVSISTEVATSNQRTRPAKNLINAPIMIFGASSLVLFGVIAIFAITSFGNSSEQEPSADSKPVASVDNQAAKETQQDPLNDSADIVKPTSANGPSDEERSKSSNVENVTSPVSLPEETATERLEGSNLASGGNQPAQTGTPTAPEDQLALNATEDSVAGDQSSETERLPKPSDAAQQKSREEIRNIFKDEYVKAKTTEQKTKLAEFLYGQAKDLQDDSTGRYVMLREAYDYAVAGGSVRLASQVVEEMGTQYQVDKLAIYLHLITALSRKPSSPDERKAVASRALELVNTAASANRFDDAMQFANLAESVAGRARAVDLRVKARNVRDEVKKLKEEQLAIQKFIEALTKDPNDPVANLRYGKYLCLVAGDWQKGLALLAKGGDSTISSIAKADLANPVEVAAREKVAEQWHELAKSEPSLRNFHARAHFWYTKSLPDASGLSEIKIKKQITAIESMNLPAGLFRIQGASSGATNPVTPSVAAKIELQPGNVFESPVAPVDYVAFSPDSSKIASGSRDNTVNIWKVKSGEKLKTLKGHTSLVYSVAFYPDGKRVASASADGSVRIWDAESGRELGKLSGHGSAVTSVAVAPDGKTVASGSHDQTVRLWDANSGESLAAFRGHTGLIKCVTFSPDGKVVASAAEDGTIKLWNAQGLQGSLDAHDKAYSVVFSPNGSILAAASEDATVKLWDMRAGKELESLEVNNGRLWSVAFFPNSRTLACAGDGRALTLWDAKTGKEVQKHKFTAPSIRCVAISKDGKTLATSGYENSIRLWTVSSKQ